MRTKADKFVDICRPFYPLFLFVDVELDRISSRFLGVTLSKMINRFGFSSNRKGWLTVSRDVQQHKPDENEAMFNVIEADVNVRRGGAADLLIVSLYRYTQRG